MNDSGKRLKNLRSILQLSQRELAAEFKVTGAAIAQWESGKRTIPGPVMKLIEIYEESLESSGHYVEKNQLRKISSSWSRRILSLLKYDNRSLQFSQESLRLALERYLDQDLPAGTVSQKIRLRIFQQIINAMGTAKGLPLKALQILTYANPGLSPELRRMILALKYSSPAIPFTIVSRLIYEEFGRTPRELFAQFSPQPFAVASIGQVHRATLHSGLQVAVKVQYPEVRESLESDFNLVLFFSRLASLLKPMNRQILDDVYNATILECDYLNEAFNQEKFREIFKGDLQIVIPKVHFEYCSQRVLTTDFIAGQDFAHFNRTATQQQKNQAARIISRFNIYSNFNFSMLHADPQADNFLFMDNKVAFLDFGRTIQFDPQLMKNHGRMFRALIHNDREEARLAASQFAFIKDMSQFDFDDFWRFLKEQQAHLINPGPYLFTREKIARSQKVADSYSGKDNMILTGDILWSTCMSYGIWTLFADLNAELDWRAMALEILDGPMT